MLSSPPPSRPVSNGSSVGLSMFVNAACGAYGVNLMRGAPAVPRSSVADTLAAPHWPQCDDLDRALANEVLASEAGALMNHAAASADRGPPRHRSSSECSTPQLSGGSASPITVGRDASVHAGAAAADTRVVRFSLCVPFARSPSAHYRGYHCWRTHVLSNALVPCEANLTHARTRHTCACVHAHAGARTCSHIRTRTRARALTHTHTLSHDHALAGARPKGGF
jgi:hypothetical protein